MANVLIAGASGFIGRPLASSLTADGHRVIRLSRRGSSGRDTVAWDPEGGRIDQEALARAQPDIVFNLAGAPIVRLWTAARKRHIRVSRVTGTSTLAGALATLDRKPAVLVSASGTNYYGSQRGDELLTEDSAPGSDFLATVAGAWEDATAPAAAAGIRVAMHRTGLVLGRGGGTLTPLLLQFNLGAGGRAGSGRQWMSWISVTDVVRGIRFLAESPRLAGPVNLVAPTPVRNAEFADILGRVLRRPVWLPMPELALRLALGEMAGQTILADLRASSARLTGAGFEFRHPQLQQALEYEIRRSGDPAGH